MLQYKGRTNAEVMNTIRKEHGSEVLIVSRKDDRDGVSIVVALSPPEPTAKEPSVEQKFRQYLQFHRAPRPVIDCLLNEAPPQATLKKSFSQMVKVIHRKPNLAELVKEKEVLIAVGLPGVGKTLAIAKIAAQASVQDKTVHVISTDKQKSGAYEQIDTLTKAIGAPLTVIENPALLQRSVDEHRKEKLVLIDTPGINPFCEKELGKLKKLVSGLKARLILVMPARGDHENCREIEAQFASIGTKHMIFTQLDLCQRLGHLLTRALESDMSIVAVGQYPEVAQVLIPTKNCEYGNLFIERVESDKVYDIQDHADFRSQK